MSHPPQHNHLVNRYCLGPRRPQIKDTTSLPDSTEKIPFVPRRVVCLGPSLCFATNNHSSASYWQSHCIPVESDRWAPKRSLTLGQSSPEHSAAEDATKRHQMGWARSQWDQVYRWMPLTNRPKRAPKIERYAWVGAALATLSVSRMMDSEASRSASLLCPRLSFSFPGLASSFSLSRQSRFLCWCVGSARRTHNFSLVIGNGVERLTCPPTAGRGSPDTDNDSDSTD